MSILVTGDRARVNGQFSRVHKTWTVETWDDGFVDMCGYFRVYRPDYPGCWHNGYAKRYAVVYWLVTQHVVAPDEALHHIDGNRTHDSFDNLCLLKHGDHSRLHHPKAIIRCYYCGRSFPRPAGKTIDRVKFCSQKCYHSSPRTDTHKQNIRERMLQIYASDQRSCSRKLTSNDVSMIQLLVRYCSQREIASMFRVSQKTVVNAINGWKKS